MHLWFSLYPINVETIGDGLKSSQLLARSFTNDGRAKFPFENPGSRLEKYFNVHFRFSNKHFFVYLFAQHISEDLSEENVARRPTSYLTTLWVCESQKASGFCSLVHSWPFFCPRLVMKFCFCRFGTSAYQHLYQACCIFSYIPLSGACQSNPWPQYPQCKKGLVVYIMYNTVRIGQSSLLSQHHDSMGDASL